MIAELAAKRIVFWGFNIPLDAHPELALRRELQIVQDPAVREPAMALLDELESARTKVEASAGNAQQLDLALDNLERVFSRITNVSATRAHGQTYAGRTIVYEDCRRDAEVTLGQDFLETLGPPLSLLLASARWLTAR